MRQRGVHAFRSGSDLFCRRAQYAAVNGRETLDRAQIAIQRNARENGVDQRPETSGPTAGSTARGSSTISTGGSFKSGDCCRRRFSPPESPVCTVTEGSDCLRRWRVDAARARCCNATKPD